MPKAGSSPARELGLKVQKNTRMLALPARPSSAPVLRHEEQRRWGEWTCSQRTSGEDHSARPTRTCIRPEVSARFLRDEESAECSSPGMGRPSIVPPLLAKVMSLQDRTGVWDQAPREAVARDLRWKVGLACPSITSVGIAMAQA
jgi:hypothetical protein